MRKYLIAIITFGTIIMLSSCSTSGYLPKYEEVEEPDFVDYYLPDKAVFETNSSWSVGNYKDRYGVSTGDTYIYNVSVDDCFSNSATSNSLCTSSLVFNGQDVITLKVLEYGDNPIASYKGEVYTFNASVIADTGYVVAKGEAFLSTDGNFYIFHEDAVQILDCLSCGLDIKISLYGTEYPISTYTLTFKAEGFATACRDILGLSYYVAPPEPEILGKVDASFNKIHCFFVDAFKAVNIYEYYEEETAKAVKEKLINEAREIYGGDITIENINYESNWAPSSLLMYFNLFGWVEKINATADVVRY